MISIIIPAHNEASVISRCCQNILHGTTTDEVEIVVVCNGCTDHTALIAKSLGPPVQVLETEMPSKSNALNLGDTHASAFPRFYLDADIVITIDAIRKTAAALHTPGILAAAPAMHVDCTDRSWGVTAFYNIWLSLPYCREGMVGSGVYAVNEQGRLRFTTFPDIISDDGFFRLQFTSEERLTLDNCMFTIHPPKNLHDLVKIKTRAFFGFLELKKLYPELLVNDGKSHHRSLKEFIYKPSLWADLCVYTYVRLLSKIKALYRFYFGITKRWDRDLSSR